MWIASATFPQFASMESMYSRWGKMWVRVRATIGTDPSAMGILPTIRSGKIQSLLGLVDPTLGDVQTFAGGEAIHLKVYTKVIEIWTMIGEGHEPLDCDACGDFAARCIA